MSEITQKALSRALYKVLRPMVRLLLRHGVSYKSFSDIARHVFVDCAESDFALPGRKPSNSRTAVLTGINRKDIAKLKDRQHPLSGDGIESPNPAARVVNAWINDERFHDGAGNPKPLAIDESPNGDANFTLLAREYSSDVPVRALLDELSRISAISKTPDRVQLLVAGYVPLADMEESLRIFGTAAADILNTMDHNIGQLEPGPFLQKTVSYNNVPPEKLSIIRRRAREEGEALLLRVNEWLSECEVEPPLLGHKTQSFRIGLGVYYIEQPQIEHLHAEANREEN